MLKATLVSASFCNISVISVDCINGSVWVLEFTKLSWGNLLSVCVVAEWRSVCFGVITVSVSAISPKTCSVVLWKISVVTVVNSPTVVLSVLVDSESVLPKALDCDVIPMVICSVVSVA